MLRCVLLLFLSNVYMAWAQTTADLVSPSSYSNVSQPSYCGYCYLSAQGGVAFIIPLASVFVPVVTTISVVTNANGTTTSTSINDTASWLFYGESISVTGGVEIATDIRQQITISAQIEALSYSTFSTANGSTSCVPVTMGVNVETDIVLPKGYGLPVTDIDVPIPNWPSTLLPSLIADIFTGQLIPPSCTANFPGDPLFQVPAQYLTTTINVNNAPASNPNPTTTSTPEPISNPPPSSSVIVVPSPTPNTQPRSTIPLASASAVALQPTSISSIIGSAITPIPALQQSAISSILQSGIVIGGQTLYPGSAITYSAPLVLSIHRLLPLS